MDKILSKLVALCKRRGFIYQGSEIYGGLAGTWDYGPLGVRLKKNLENIWWKRFVLEREDMYGIDAAILMNPQVWKASGHVDGFTDPLVECKKCKRRFRADTLEDKNKCPDCEGQLGEERRFNMMFETKIGASEVTKDGVPSITYLRPETAQGMFVNFKNVVDSFHPKLPFGLAQIGKAFRNEIAPRDFIFRVRELEQMEIEYFVKPSEWEVHFEEFRKESLEFWNEIGLPKEKIHELEVGDGDRAHYSKRTIDFEFDFPFGRKELSGLAYRTDFDLKSQGEGSKTDLSYFDEESKERIIPHCIEPSFGVGRAMLAVLSSAYAEDELGGETRTFLKLSPAVAPYLLAIFPLLKNRPEIVTKAKEIYQTLKSHPKLLGRMIFDDNGNIGKRYRRQDEIGTPWCVTVDFDTLGENPTNLDTVTLRNRDTGEQERIKIDEIVEKIT